MQHTAMADTLGSAPRLACGKQPGCSTVRALNAVLGGPSFFGCCRRLLMAADVWQVPMIQYGSRVACWVWWPANYVGCCGWLLMGASVI